MAKILIIFVLVLFSLFAMPQDFEVAPVLINFKAESGTVQTTKLTVKNYANIKQKFELKLSDYIIDENGAKKSMPVGTTDRSCANWLTVNPSFMELNPNESKQIDVIMTVPKAQGGTKWGMIHVQVAKEKTAIDADKDMATGIIVVPRIVVLVKQSPKSNNNYSGKIEDLKEITKEGDDFRKFEAKLINDGDKVIDAKISLSVANIITAKEQKFKRKKFTVYPGHNRIITVTLPINLEPGKYAIAVIMDYGHRKAIEGVQMIIEQ